MPTKYGTLTLADILAGPDESTRRVRKKSPGPKRENSTTAKPDVIKAQSSS